MIEGGLWITHWRRAGNCNSCASDKGSKLRLKQQLHLINLGRGVFGVFGCFCALYNVPALCLSKHSYRGALIHCGHSGLVSCGCCVELFMFNGRIPWPGDRCKPADRARLSHSQGISGHCLK